MNVKNAKTEIVLYIYIFFFFILFGTLSLSSYLIFLNYIKITFYMDIKTCTLVLNINIVKNFCLCLSKLCGAQHNKAFMSVYFKSIPEALHS